MGKKQDIYIYFNKLEKRLKLSLAILLFLLLVLSTLFGISIKGTLDLIKNSSAEITVMVVLVTMGILVLLIYLLNKGDWLGELHAWLDKYFFGYLQKSNNAILNSLLYALKPEERTEVMKLNEVKQNEMVQSIFSLMSNNERFFSILIETKIFSKWTWYWATIYSLLTFTYLTLLSFIFAVIKIDPYIEQIFTICLLITIIALSIVNILGHKLVNYSKFIVDTLVEANKKQIADILRENISMKKES